MLSRKIAAPLMLLAILLFYLANAYDAQFAKYIAIPIILLAVVYVMQHQIDYWWAKRHTPPLAAPLEALLGNVSPFYRMLNSDEKKRFRNRVVLGMMAKEFIFMRKESSELPKDIQLVLSSQLVQLTFGQEQFLLSPFDRIVVYAHPFPSPSIQQLHSSEVHFEDGAFVFDLENAMLGIMQSAKYFNIAVYEYARVFCHLNKQKINLPKENEFNWVQLFAIRGVDRNIIEMLVGGVQLDLLAVAIEHFLAQPRQFQAVLPEMYETLQRSLNINPLKTDNPVTDYYPALNDTTQLI